MDKYTIYCTPSQTKKALEAGAPIEELLYTKDFENAKSSIAVEINHLIRHYEIPTAEQMIGWLEEQNQRIDISSTVFDNGDLIYGYLINDYEFDPIEYPSRREATLAAIDSALGYLMAIKERQ